MSEIKCPKCHTVFTIDEADYNSIAKQIRDNEFNNEIKRQLRELEEKMNLEIDLLKKEYTREKETEISIKNKEIDELKHRQEMLESEYNLKLQDEISKKEMDYEKSKADSNNLVVKLESEIRELKGQLKSADDVRLNEVKSVIAQKELEKEKSLREALEKKENELNTLRNDFDSYKNESNARLEIMQNRYEEKLLSKDRELADKQVQVDYYKDLKTKMSTKMIGESLEQHCAYEFNKNRMAMFPRAYFEKDNDIKSGSKGDFIFKDFDEDNVEILSIMFEMKNEADTTATKHKNEDFFKELDKDRREKNCEYAILVSLLESDNELYNEGIVDVSYKYPKMYVIRPQFFIPIITLLKNASLNALSYKKQLMVERENNLDVTHFEENMEAFKMAFGKNYEIASRKFNEAIDEIDKSIMHLQKIKDALTSSDRQLRLANDKAQDLSIKKLTKNAPSVREKFDSLKGVQEDEYL